MRLTIIGIIHIEISKIREFYFFGFSYAEMINPLRVRCDSLNIYLLDYRIHIGIDKEKRNE